MSPDKYTTPPHPDQQGGYTAVDTQPPPVDDLDTISVSIRWRRSRAHLSWIEVNGKPLGEYHPLQNWPRHELDRAGHLLRSVAGIYDPAEAEHAP
jgi:hypothetical protein